MQQTVNSPARPVDQRFLSPGLLADSLFNVHRLAEKSALDPTTSQSQGAKPKQSAKSPTRPRPTKSFLSPRSLAESLLKQHRECETVVENDQITGSNGTHRARSKQRSSRKPMSRSQSTKRSSVSIGRSQTPAIRSATALNDHRAQSVEPHPSKT